MRRIVIHSVPRSGSTWLGEIFNSNERVCYKFQPLFSYYFKGRLSENSSINDINLFFGELEQASDDFLDRKTQREEGILPVFKKNPIKDYIVYKEVRYHNILKNLLEKDDGVILVALVRNPLAVLSSWFNAPREFRKDLGWKELEEWRAGGKKNEGRPEEFYGFEKWRETAELFSLLKNQYPNRVYLVDYNTLLRDTESCVNELFEFCELKMTSQTKTFISKSRNSTKTDTYSVFKEKSKDNQWVDSLNDSIVRTITEELKGTDLEKYLQ